MLLRVVALFTSLSCCAAVGTLDSAIESFPEVWTYNYRPDLAAECANVLISAGKDAACSALEGAATTQRERMRSHALSDQKLAMEDNRINQKLCHLCRLLFVPTNSSEILRRPGLGALSRPTV